MFEWLTKFYNFQNSNSKWEQKRWREEVEFFVCGKSVKLHKNSSDILVVPEGRKEDVPSEFHHNTIELPNSYSCAVIK